VNLQKRLKRDAVWGADLCHSCVGPRNHVIDGVHIGTTWRIRLNDPCAAAMRPYVRWLFGLVSVCRTDRVNWCAELWASAVVAAGERVGAGWNKTALRPATTLDVALHVVTVVKSSTPTIHVRSVSHAAAGLSVARPLTCAQLRESIASGASARRELWRRQQRAD